MEENIIFEKLIQKGYRLELFESICMELKTIARNLADINTKYMELNIGLNGLKIPLIYREKKNPNSPLFSVIGGQHNEYNGTFGMLKFLSSNSVESLREWIKTTKGGFIFVPIANPTGFLHPMKTNKWGYFSSYNKRTRSVNLNRHWNKTLNYPTITRNTRFIPVVNRNLGSFLLTLRQAAEHPKSQMYVLDFHETSLVTRFRKEMAIKLSKDYKIDHWIKKWILESVLHKYYGKSVRYEESIYQNYDFKQLKHNLKEMNLGINEKTFYFICHAGNLGEKWAKIIDNGLNSNYESDLYECFDRTLYLPYSKSGDFTYASSSKEWLTGITIEMKKVFFNLFEERKKSKNSKEYKNRLQKIFALNIDLTKSAIKESLNFLNF